LSTNRDTERLLKEEFKLNSYESRIYIALLKRGMNSRKYTRPRECRSPGCTTRSGASRRRVSLSGWAQSTNLSGRPWPLESRISRLKEQSEAEHGQRENAKKTLVEILQPMYEGRVEKLQDPVLLKALDATASRLLEILTLSKDVIFLVKKAIKVKDAMKRYLETTLLEGRRVRIIFPSNAKLTPDDIELTKKLGVELAWHDNPLLDRMVADETDAMLGVPDPMSEDPFSAIVVWIRDESFARATKETLEATWKSPVLKGRGRSSTLTC